VPDKKLDEKVFKQQQAYERIIESDNYDEIIRMYTKDDVFPKLNAQLRFAKRDMFLLSASIISSKITNALMVKQKENPALVFAGTCFRGINITKSQLNQFTEHLKNIITFSAFTSSTVSEIIAIRFMLDFDEKKSSKIDLSKDAKEVNDEERIPILFKFNVKKEANIKNMISQEEVKEEEK
jgi:hypothetical protein